MSSFKRELCTLINFHSMENGSDTPDFILAKYLVACLEAFEVATVLRDERYNITHTVVNETGNHVKPERR